MTRQEFFKAVDDILKVLDSMPLATSVDKVNIMNTVNIAIHQEKQGTSKIPANPNSPL